MGVLPLGVLYRYYHAYCTNHLFHLLARQYTALRYAKHCSVASVSEAPQDGANFPRVTFTLSECLFCFLLSRGDYLSFYTAIGALLFLGSVEERFFSLFTPPSGGVFLLPEKVTQSAVDPLARPTALKLQFSLKNNKKLLKSFYEYDIIIL